MEHRGNHKERALVSHGKLEIYGNFPLCTGITSFPKKIEELHYYQKKKKHKMHFSKKKKKEDAAN